MHLHFSPFGRISALSRHRIKDHPQYLITNAAVFNSFVGRNYDTFHCMDVRGFSFSYGYAMFGMLGLVIVCGILALEVWQTTLCLSIMSTIFFESEFRLHCQICEALNNSKYIIRKCKNMIWVTALMLIAACSIVVFKDFFGWMPLDETNTDFRSTYMKTLSISLSVNAVFLSFKLIALTFRLVNLFQIKRGIFAVLHRITIITRSFLVSPFWIAYFSESPNGTFFSTLSKEGGAIAKMYVFVISIYHMRLIFDVDEARRAFSSEWKKVFGRVNDVSRCRLVCHESEDIPIVMSCGHVFSPREMIKIFPVSPFCPICGAGLAENAKTALFDSDTSFSSVFCCF